MIIETFFKLWNKGIFESKQMKRVYDSCQAYIDQFLGLSKKDMTGS